MPCCGNRRAAYHSVPAVPGGNTAGSFRGLASTEFEYTGHGQLTVTGPVTGVVYRFQAHGQRLLVHGSDVASVRAVPQLRALR